MKIAIALVTVFVVAGCTTDAAPDSRPEQISPPGALGPDDGLTLVNVRPDRITGSYVDPTTRASLVFDAVRAGDVLSMHLSTGDGRALVDIDTVGDTYRFSYLGGRLTMTVDRAWVEAVRTEGEDGPAAQDDSALRWDGDMSVLDETLLVPEMKSLPWMSRALGVRGITGSAFPASLALHKMARQSADALSVEVPAVQVQGDTAFCSRPTANECYGMCGPGCSCWSWVCGDCCYHYGCARHDTWCRQGQWYYCYNITAVIALFGC